MKERHVRTDGRPVYGRVRTLSRPVRKRGAGRASLSPVIARLGVLMVLIMICGWGIAQLFALQKISVNAPARQHEIEVEARSLIASNWWWGNILTFDSSRFVSKLQQQDSILRNVSVKRKIFHSIVITASLKQPSLGWVTGNQAYVLDRDGTVIASANNASAYAVVYDGSNLPVQIGQRAASAHFVEFASQVGPALAAIGIGTTRLDIKETTLDLSAQTNKGYRILFDTSRGVGEEISDLKAVQKLMAAQKRLPAEYIDLRIAGKAYYK